jgi:microcystin degradation protein MlrC
MKVALAQFIYESNTFNPVAAEMACFTEQGVWLTTPAAIEDWMQETDSQMSGSRQVLVAAGHEAIPVMVAVCGTPGGRLSARGYETLKTTFLAGLRAVGPVDAMVLHLHGAVCAEGIDDVEGAWLAAVREELKFEGPVVLSLDLHANVTPRMLRYVDAVTSYRTAPHEDFVETGERAALMLLDLPGSTTRTLATVSALIPPPSTHHEVGPFAAMLRRARELEHLPGIVEISLFPVQPWLDVEGLATSVVVTSTDAAMGEQVAGELATAWYDQRTHWKTGLIDWAEIKHQLAQPTDGPWVLVDTADATTGGSHGGSAEAIRQLWPLRDQLPGEVLLWVVDPPAATGDAPLGAEVEMVLDGIAIHGELRYAGPCRFRPRGRAYTGQVVSCGEARVVAAGRLRIVATAQGCLCSDPAFFEAVGLQPDSALAVHVKSLLGWQPGYGVTAARGLYFDGPGHTSLDFARLSFSGERRELFPISNSPSNPISLWQSI